MVVVIRAEVSEASPVEVEVLEDSVAVSPEAAEPADRGNFFSGLVI